STVTTVTATGLRPLRSSQRRARCIKAILSGPPDTARRAVGKGSRQENVRKSAASPMMLVTVHDHVRRTLRAVRPFLLDVSSLQNRLRALRVAALQFSEGIAGGRILAEPPKRNRQLQKRFRRALIIREIRESFQEAVRGRSVFTVRKSRFSKPILRASRHGVFRILIDELLKIGLSRRIFAPSVRPVGL